MSELRDKVDAALKAHEDMKADILRAVDELIIASVAEKVAHLAKLVKAKADLEQYLKLSAPDAPLAAQAKEMLSRIQ